MGSTNDTEGVFVVTRQSQFDGEQPAPGTVKRTVGKLHRRTVNEAEFDQRFAGHEGTWRSKGRDHTTWSGEREAGVQRTEDHEAWVFEGDLLQFIRQVGSCVVSPPGTEYADLFEVEINDGYH